MKILINNKNDILVKDFPMSVFEVQDTLDILGVPHDRNITFVIFQTENSKLPSALFNRRYTADIYKLNLFAERIEKLDNMEMTAFKSLLTAYPDSSFDDMIKMTYGYESPDINIEFGEPKRCFFRLLIAPAPINDESTEQFAQWLSLPCEKENLNDIAKDLGIDRVQDMVCYDFQSALPTICDENFGDMHRIDELNVLAQRLSDLSEHDFVKLKAVMESENIREISDTMNCIDRLGEYEFDIFVSDESEFGRTYFAKNMPTNFDDSVLEKIDLYDFSEKILERTGGKITSYGAISGRGQELYSLITVQREQTQVEENAEDICEDFSEEDESEDFEMGGMSM